MTDHTSHSDTSAAASHDAGTSMDHTHFDTTSQVSVILLRTDEPKLIIFKVDHGHHHNHDHHHHSGSLTDPAFDPAYPQPPAGYGSIYMTPNSGSSQRHSANSHRPRESAVGFLAFIGMLILFIYLLYYVNQKKWEPHYRYPCVGGSCP